MLFGSLCEHFRVVDTLGSGGDLLSTHEKVVRVCVVLVIGVKHRVEGTGTFGEAVQHVEVSVVLLSHKPTQGTLSLGRQILKRCLVSISCTMEQFNSLFEVNFDARGSTEEFLKWVLVRNDSQLPSTLCLQAVENIRHELSNQVEHFEVVILELHLQIETSELT